MKAIKRKLVYKSFTACFGLLLTGNCWAQVQSGGSFLKTLPGARNHGMAVSLTGTIDELHSIYGNPAATGFLREWQWSTTYTEWFADTYQASLHYSRRLSLPWSRRAQVALGIQYQGIREFDSTGEGKPAASASDMLISASYGNALSFISPQIAFGVNLKYFRSVLANFSASSWIYDFGLLYKSDRFKLTNPLFQHAIITAGLAVNNIGPSLTFINTGTPLPRIFRIGTALHLGTHTGLQMLVAADLRKVRDEDIGLSLGTEVSWNYRLALRSGYNFNSDALGRVSFGMSFKIDDELTLFANVPGRNKALRLDIAGLEKNSLFSGSYHVSASLYPVAPEAFDLIFPLSGMNLPPRQIEFAWTPSVDPDLYDKVSYMLLLERHERQPESGLKLRELLKAASQAESQPMSQVFRFRQNMFWARTLSFEEQGHSNKLTYDIDELPAGEYYWSLVAFDKDNHVRFAGRKGGEIGHFRILPDLIITDLNFRPNQWITDSDFQGEIDIKVANIGSHIAEHANVVVFDSLLTHVAQYANTDGYTNGSGQNNLVAGLEIVKLAAGKDTLLTIPWNAGYQGEHRISVEIDPGDLLHEFDEKNNHAIKAYATIPRGVFGTDSVVVTQIDSLYEYELPFIPKIYFKHGSDEIQKIESSLIYSSLETLVERIDDARDIVVKLQGSADYKNGETKKLAQSRTNAVKAQLVELGLDKSLIKSMPPVSETEMDSYLDHKLDRAWVLAERRFVRIKIFKKNDLGRQDTRFLYSVPVSLPRSKIFLPAKFANSLHGFIGAEKIIANVYSDSVIHQSFDLQYASTSADTIVWYLDEQQKKTLENSILQYSVILTDKLGRQFSTQPTQVKFRTKKRNLLNKRIIIGVAEFREDKPGANLYWSSVASRVNERLEDEEIESASIVGHACAIGDSSYNRKLSLARAVNFFTEFRARYPKLFRKMNRELGVIDLLGLGERESFRMVVDKKLFLETLRLHNQEEFKEITYELVSRQKHNPEFPFTFTLHSDGILIESDNNTAFGRQINRRIEIRLEPKEKSKPKEITRLVQPPAQQFMRTSAND